MWTMKKWPGVGEGAKRIHFRIFNYLGCKQNNSGCRWLVGRLATAADTLPTDTLPTDTITADGGFCCALGQNFSVLSRERRDRAR